MKSIDEGLEILADIPIFEELETIHLIEKGWSSDKKYHAVNKSGDRLLIRVSDIEYYDAKKNEYDIIAKYSSLNIKMSSPLGFGICNSGNSVYMILTWIDGNDLSDVLKLVTEDEQYQLGIESGKILKRIHSISLEVNENLKNKIIGKKIRQLDKYENSDVRIDNDEFAIKYVRNNISKILSCNPVYQHGDFHPSNLILIPTGEIGVIDFNRWDIGDPYEEFYKLQLFGTELSTQFCIGFIDGYFNSQIPNIFWEILAVYVAQASLYSIKWAEKFCDRDVIDMVRRCKKVFDDYDQFKNVIPKWYNAN